jgi:hypothetical protein
VDETFAVTRKAFPEPVIVRGRRWFRSPLGWVWILVVVIGATLIVYGLGRAGIGPGVPGILASLGGLRDELRDRDATITELRRQLADYDTSKTAQEEERRELARTIGELQAEVARLRQQVEFYRGVVASDNPRAPVAIRSLRIVQSLDGAAPVLRLALVQPGNPQSIVSGLVQPTIEGRRAGRFERISLASRSFSFRYFENLELAVTWPTGFVPERVTVEIRGGGRNTAPVVQSLLWPAKPDAS